MRPNSLSLNLMRHSIVDLRFSATDTDTYLHACSARTLTGYSVRMKNEQHFLSSQLAQSTHSCYSSHSKYTHISVLRKLERNGMEHNGFFLAQFVHDKYANEHTKPFMSEEAHHFSKFDIWKSWWRKAFR